MSPIVNPADDADDCLQVHEVWRGFHGRILPETIFVFCCIAGSDMCEEDGFVLRLMYLEGLWEVESNYALKFAKECLLDEILGFVIVGIAVNEALVLQ